MILTFMRKTLLIVSVFLLVVNFRVESSNLKIYSPDKNTAIEIGLSKQKELQYRILYVNKVAMSWSSIGLVTNAGVLGSNVSLKTGETTLVNERFPWSLGENDTIDNVYRQANVVCTSGGISCQIVARIYNGAVAFRYIISNQESKITQISAEKTTFNFPGQALLYQYNQESVFTPTVLDTLRKTSDFPTTVRCNKLYYSIGEAENTCYTKAELKKTKDSNGLQVTFQKDSAVNFVGEFNSPWRTIAISKTAIGLHQFADLYLKLNSTNIQQIPNWIKPGKLIRSQLNTKSGLDCIDFAAKHNLQYIMFDAGWYGHEFRSFSDPTQVIPEMDLPQIITYGKEKGVGVILYVNKVGLYQKLDSILPLYKKWGVAGFKFGFVDGLTQKGLTWLNQAIQKVYDYGFILNIHDNYKPTGLSRKYPNLLTQEGIRGDENSPDAFHTTTLPFTRFLAGPADFTFCYPNSRETFSKNLKVSMAQQLALSVIYFSPLQSLYWYGKPLDYTNDAEIEFFDKIPTVWNESHYLAGEIGENIAVARRSADAWFLGAVAGLNDWKHSLKLDFLKNGIAYQAMIYTDSSTKSISKTTKIVHKGDQLLLNITAKGGKAIIFKPIIE